MASTALKILSLCCAMRATTALVSSLSSVRSLDVISTDPAVTEKCPSSFVKISEMSMEPGMSARIDLIDRRNGEVSLTSADGPKTFCVDKNSDMAVSFGQMSSDDSIPFFGKGISNMTKAIANAPVNEKRKSYPIGEYNLQIKGTATAGLFNMMQMSADATCPVCGVPCNVCATVAGSLFPGPCVKLPLLHCPKRLRIPPTLLDMIPKKEMTFPPIKLHLPDLSESNLAEVIPENPAVQHIQEDRKEQLRALAEFQGQNPVSAVFGNIHANFTLSLSNPDGEVVRVNGEMFLSNDAKVS